MNTGLTTEEHLNAMGREIRELRQEQGLRLSDLAQATGISQSMLSMIERGQANPSIGTLVAISDALKVPITRLFGQPEDASTDPVHRREQQQVLTTAPGVQRRILATDLPTGLMVSQNTYAPGTASAGHPLKHGGRECGVVLEGELTVEINGMESHLRAGDSILFDSTKPHRFINRGKVRACTVWVNYKP